MSKRKKAAFAIICVALSCLLLEIGLRAVWCLKFNASFLQPDYISTFYPELTFPASQSTRRNDVPFDILLLGGSVLHHGTAHVDSRLQELLTYHMRREVRIYNVAVPGHTSLDSLVKYTQLAKQHFDLVVFYHGINEARANNCPPELFQADYSHYAWYERLHVAQSHPAGDVWITPSAVRQLCVIVKQSVTSNRYVPLHRPREEWVEYGADIKSAASFEQNLRRILDLARTKREPVLLMTFAHHLPDDYSYNRFHLRQLDYAAPLHSVDIWGAPEHVVAAIDKHNQIVARLAQEYRTTLVDQNALMPKKGPYFNDICHLTHEGTRLFVAHMLTGQFAIDDDSVDPGP